MAKNQYRRISVSANHVDAVIDFYIDESVFQDQETHLIALLTLLNVDSDFTAHFYDESTDNHLQSMSIKQLNRVAQPENYSIDGEVYLKGVI